MSIANVSSTLLNLRGWLNLNTSAFSASLERMSSGFKLSTSSNASDVVLSRKFDIKTSSMNIALNNTQSAVAMLDIADSYLSKMSSVVDRIRELSLEAMNSTYSKKERDILQIEALQLCDELYRLKSSAKFNSLNIFGDDETVDKTESVDKVENVSKLYKAELEYIETSGSEYIDTGIIGKSGLSCEVDIFTTNSKNDTGLIFLGSIGQTNAIRLLSGGTSGFYTVYGGVNNYSRMIGNSYNKRIKVTSELYDGNQNIQNEKGDKCSTKFSGDINTGFTMYLFAGNVRGGVARNADSGTRLYSCKIYDKGNIVRDYIPVLDNNDVACLYDKVSGEFFYDESGGSFIEGPKTGNDPPIDPNPPPDSITPSNPEGGGA